MNQNRTEHKRLGQPHYQHIGAVFSVTITAHDAIPKQVIERLNERRKVVILAIENDDQPMKNSRKQAIWNKYYAHLEYLLHKKAIQEHPFRCRSIAKAVQHRIEQYDGTHYHLLAYAILSNHIHLQLDFSVQCPQLWDGISAIPDYVNLATVIGQIKGGSTFDANKATGRKGTLWNKGYYDRYMRDSKHLTTEFWYIVRNAETAGLVDNWRQHPFTYGCPSLTG